MKKKLALLLATLMCISLCACGGSETNSGNNADTKTEESGNNTNKEIEENNSATQTESEFEIMLSELGIIRTPAPWTEDMELANRIKYVYFGCFFTKDGELYKFSLDENKVFDNELRYQKIETDYRVDRFFYDAIFTLDGKILYMDFNAMDGYYGDIEIIGDYSELAICEKTENGYIDCEISEPIYLDCDYKLKNPWYLLYSRNNKIYIGDLDKRENWTYFLQGTFSEIGEIPEGEKFLDYYCGTKYIKTDKAFYYIGVVNQEEVDKYVEAVPQYGIVKDEVYSKYYDDILYYDGRWVIFKEYPNIIFN